MTDWPSSLSCLIHSMSACISFKLLGKRRDLMFALEEFVEAPEAMAGERLSGRKKPSRCLE